MRRLVKFAFVGGCGAVVNLAIVWLCVASGWRVELAVGAGIVVSIFTNFVLNSRWTWGDRTLDVAGWIRGLGRYYVLAAGGAALQFGIAWVVREVATQHYLVASAAGIVVGAASTFAGADRFVFVRRPQAA
jgi:dolichol-phosphate mannosyltransferase